jgi:hypothetical protein
MPVVTAPATPYRVLSPGPERGLANFMAADQSIAAPMPV